jgi:hypothetical protein
MRIRKRTGQPPFDRFTSEPIDSRPSFNIEIVTEDQVPRIDPHRAQFLTGRQDPDARQDQDDARPPVAVF